MAKSFLDIEHNIENFKESISESMTHGSVRCFESMFRAFDNFCISKYQKGMHEVISEIHRNPGNAVWKVLQDWINYAKKEKLSTTTIRLRFSLLNKYLYWMGIKLDTRDVQMNLNFPSKVKEKKYPLKLEEIHRIFSVARYDKKVLYICQLSSLMRIGELCQLRKKDLDLSRPQITVNIPASIAKFDKERTTFFSKEASAMLRPKLKNLDDNDVIFPLEVKEASNAGAIEQATLAEYLAKIGLDMRYESSGYLKISTHSFRAYGITKVKRIDPALAYFLAGQESKIYLPQYDRLAEDPEELYQTYLKIEPELLIFERKEDTEEYKEKIALQVLEKISNMDALEFMALKQRLGLTDTLKDLVKQ